MRIIANICKDPWARQIVLWLSIAFIIGLAGWIICGWFFPFTQEDHQDVSHFLSFLSLLTTVGIAIIAYSKLKPMAEKADAEFIFHIDERWCSPEITNVRCALWKVYREGKGKNKEYDEKQAFQRVWEHIDVIKTHNSEEMYRYLNFLELLGTISLFHEKGYLKEDLLEKIFGGTLKTYIRFYEGYLRKHPEILANDLLLKFIDR